MVAVAHLTLAVVVLAAIDHPWLVKALAAELLLNLHFQSYQERLTQSRSVVVVLLELLRVMAGTETILYSARSLRQAVVVAVDTKKSE